MTAPALTTPVKGVLLAAPPATPGGVVALLLAAPATALVPEAALPQSEVQFLEQWTPGAVVSQVPQAAVQSLTPSGIAAMLTPSALVQNATQTLAMAAVLAVLA